MSKNKLAAIIIVCTIAIIVAIVLIQVKPWERTPSAETYTLTTIVSPSGAGSVSPSGGEYESGEQVTVTASPDSGYSFDYWSGSASGATSTITITMDSDKSLTANFETIPTVPEVLFSDDFSDESSGWVTYDEFDGRVIYHDGCLYIKDYTYPEETMYSESQLYFTDFILEVETWLVGGTDYNWHYVACRFRDDNNYYGFAIGADGMYAIAKWIDGNMTYFVTTTYSSYINQGVGAVNLIHIECIGSSLSLSVNGHLLWEGTDATFTGGNIALAANAQAGTFTEVAFDNIIVTKPFETIPTVSHDLTISVNGQGTTNPSVGTYEYDSGTQVTTTASPASGWKFDHWSGDASGTSATIVITMDSNKDITAHFEEEPPVTSEPIIFAGSSDTKTPPFTVTTWEWIIDWSYIPDYEYPEYAGFGFYVYPRGEAVSYVESVVFPGSTSGSTYSYAGPGDYYIEVICANIESWEITIRPP